MSLPECSPFFSARANYFARPLAPRNDVLKDRIDLADVFFGSGDDLCVLHRG
jgi:hypothetical protein